MSRKVQFNLDFEKDLENYLKKKYPDLKDYRVLSKSLDARGANRGKRPKFQYNIEFITQNERFEDGQEEFKKRTPFENPPIIVGAGPAGLFCALRFSEYGIPTVIVERGGEALHRMKKISKFWRYGELDENDNVCYGEGGAGLFSDGKLITRVKSPHIKYVMNKFVEFGAPKETAYVSNPHLGSNKIRNLITTISKFLKENGHQIRYHSKVVKILQSNNQVEGVELASGEKIYSSHVILATGHSASDIYYHLKSLNVEMQSKDFAVGVRIEHPRQLIDKLQHGDFCFSEVLGTARYRLSYHNEDTDKGTYSFCMCPGGYVLSSGTEKDGIVVNGMSNYARRSPWSNSALVVSVKAGVDFKLDDVMAGLEYQRNIEKKAYQYSLELGSGKEVPAQSVKNFLDDKEGLGSVKASSCPSKLYSINLKSILPESITHHLNEALAHFDHKMSGFVSNNALLMAPETRTSSPLTILRSKDALESLSISGLYPCGEGAGYAGGITSAAVDGIKVCESIVKQNT